MPPVSQLQIIGHRGGVATRYPENSIAAFQAGIKAGASGIELDVHLSRDGRVMVIHDDGINRISDGKGSVVTMGAAEIRRYHLRDSAGRAHDDCVVPVLEEVFEACEAVTFNIDLKTASPELAREVAGIIERYGAEGRTTVASFLPEALRFFRSIAPSVSTATHPDEVRTLLLARLKRERPSISATRVQVPLWSGLVPIITKGFVRYVHELDMQIDAWTLNTPRHIRKALTAAVDGIITDNIALTTAVVGGYYAHS